MNNSYSTATDRRSSQVMAFFETYGLPLVTALALLNIVLFVIDSGKKDDARPDLGQYQQQHSQQQLFTGRYDDNTTQPSYRPPSGYYAVWTCQGLDTQSGIWIDVNPSRVLQLNQRELEMFKSHTGLSAFRCEYGRPYY